MQAEGTARQRVHEAVGFVDKLRENVAALATPSSATTSGVAAELRAAKKVAKYDPLATVLGSAFRAAVVERYGSMCDSLVGHIRMLWEANSLNSLK